MEDRPEGGAPGAVAQLTFVPGDPVPGAGLLALYGTGDLAATASALALPPGEAGRLPTVARTSTGGVHAWDAPARLIAVLPGVRRLAALPPGSDWRPWQRPAPSVLAWSLAAKLALELVAAGRLLPDLVPADDPRDGLATWRIVPPTDGRLQALAAALPPVAHAVRRSGVVTEIHAADELLLAFLDAVADACAREGRRPALDPRRRGSRRPWVEAWPAALAGSEPTVSDLRVPVDEIAADLAEWAGPVRPRDRRADVRLALRLAPPPVTGDGAHGLSTGLDGPWTLTIGLGVGERVVPATDVWRTPGRLEADGRHVDDAPAVLTRLLAAAARLFPPLDRTLSASRPEMLELAPEEAAALLSDGIDALGAAGVLVEVPPELRDAETKRLRLRVRIGQTTEIGGRVAPGLLALPALADVRYEVALGDDALAPADLDRVVALAQPLVRWRGQWVRVDVDEAARLRDLGGRTATLEATEALASALAGQTEDDELGWLDVVPDGDVAELVERLREAPAPGEATIRHIEGELRPYQERGVAWLQRLVSFGSGGVLADAMGLGKTLQAIALLTSRPSDRPHLVVCPTSVVGNWERELRRFAPRLRLIRHHGPERPDRRSQLRPGHVVVTSYALMRRDASLLTDIRWDVVVLDEAQQIKNPTSKGARVARALDARARIAMTGTPVENRLTELWSIVDVTNPGLLGSRRRFEERYAVPIERWHDDAAAARLRRLVAPFILRRAKDDPEVALDLPPKQLVTVACTLTREQAALYQASLDDAFRGGLGGTTFERRGRILALLTALKQICNHPAHYLRDGGRLAGRSGKLARATEILAEVAEAGDHALVFTQFRVMGELLARHLAAELELPDVPFLHGGLSLGARDRLVARFQEDDDAPPILLVSLRAGGTGLNLTRATEVVHFDRWWNPAVEDQATDRAHRIGQTRAVTVHTLVTAGTVEERIATLLERKRGLADAVVGTGESWITELDDEDLHELLALSTDDVEDEEDVA